MRLQRRLLKLALTALALALGGCSLEPVYYPPTVAIAGDQWKDSPWQPAQPADRLPRGNWWTVYGDAGLNELEDKVDAGNPNLASALARYEQAAAYIDQLRSGLFPSIDSGAAFTQNRQSDNRPLRGSNQPDVYMANTVAAGASYDLDLWGRVRSLVHGGQASAQASADELENVRLSLHAQLADYYVRLRGLDEQTKLLNDTVETYTRALNFTQRRHAGGIASGLDVARAQTQVSLVRSQVSNIAAQRALVEHAIASLTGVPAMSFSLAPAQTSMTVPQVPVAIPSVLLQRRPDLAAAERRVAAANAGIGVARAAFYPDISLMAGYGFQNTGGAGLLTVPNSFWTLGPSMIFNLFDAGLREAKLQQAKALVEQTGADYRSAALAAFQQVQDDLSQLKYYHESEMAQDEAMNSSSKALTLAFNRYREGAVNYLEVVTAQTDALSAQRSALDLHTLQLRTSVDLIRALGGGWSQESLADANAKALASKQ